MTICSHPSESALLGYASGNIPAGISLALAAHLSLCRVCRMPVLQWEAAGGAMLESLSEARMADDALEHTLRRLHEQHQPGQSEGRQPGWLNLDLPAALRMTPIHRRLWIAPGIWKVNIGAGEAKGHAYLLRLGANRRIPLHGHSTQEAICVLKGSFSDSSGCYSRGDFVEIEAATDHQPIAGPEGECICIVASEAPPRFSGAIGRIVGRLLGG